MENANRSFILLLISVCVLAFGFEASASNSGVTYQGRIVKPDGTALSGRTTQFKMQIRTPDSQNCLMYEEMQSQDLSETGGQFSLTINDGTGSRTDSTSLTLDKIFANHGSYTFDPTTCSTGLGTYAPNASDGRNLVVLFKDETMTAWEPIPAQKINFVPFAFEAKQVAGFTSQSLVRVAETDGTLDSVSPLSNAQYAALLSLANGYTTGALSSTTSTTRSLTINPSSPNNNGITFLSSPSMVTPYSLTWPLNAGTANQVLTTDGSGNLTWAAPTTGEMEVVEQDADGAAQINCTVGSWIARTLNTVVNNSITGASLASSQVTLPAGTYIVEGSALGISTNDHQAVFYNVTSSSFDVLGTLSRAVQSGGTTSDSLLMGKVILAAPAVYELRHRCEYAGQFSRGSPSWGIPSLSAIVKIRKIQ